MGREVSKKVLAKPPKMESCTNFIFICDLEKNQILSFTAVLCVLLQICTTQNLQNIVVKNLSTLEKGDVS